MQREYTHDVIAQLYRESMITDEQLDGTGAEPGSIHVTNNFVAKLNNFTQEQADAIRAGAQDPVAADMLEAIQIYEGGASDGTV